MKKFGAMDQAIGGVQDQVSKLQPGIQAAAAFSATYQARAKTDKQARAERVVTQASTEGRIEPKDKAIHLSHLMGLDDTVKFSATGVSERSPFELHSDDLLNRAVSPYFRETMVDADGEPGKATAYANRVMAQIPSARSLPAKKVA
jgi:hypothetical protein